MEERIEKSVHKNKKKIRITIILAIIAVTIVGSAIVLPLVFHKANKTVIIRIPSEATIQTVGDTLRKYFDETYASAIVRAASLRGSDFSKRHGAYQIEQGMNAINAERKLSKGAQYPITVTINGFRGRDKLAEKVSSKLDFSASEFLKAINDQKILSEYGMSSDEILALFLDDSYQFYWSASPEDFINKIGKHYKSVWNDERKEKASHLGMTPLQICILASIVEEETNKPSDKGIIGRLYINRLKKGMKLQADPTVRFALNDFTIKRIRNIHLQTESPYNTYRVSGLPPGPIRTVNMATIDSILDSKPNDYLYMCAKDDFSGYHVFATDYASHLKNARKYQQALNRRNIK